MTGVDPEEAEAIAEAVGSTARPALGVAARDFSEPRRLSVKSIERARALATACLPEVAEGLGRMLRATHRLALGVVSEVNAGAVLDELGEPFAVACFEGARGEGWLVWDGAAAAATVEMILTGAQSDDPTRRRLSQTEGRVLERALALIVDPIANALQAPVGDLRFVQSREELASSTVEDPQRLLVHLFFEGPGEPSELRLYLPGVSLASTTESSPPSASVPDHIGPVMLELQACLGSTEIPLADLLKLEVGDVIPLGVRHGDPIEIQIDERACGTARWGQHKGSVAVQLDQVDFSASPTDPPPTG